MGEEAVCLTLKTDENMEESGYKTDLKRPRDEDECNGAECPNKKPFLVKQIVSLHDSVFDTVEINTVHDDNVVECVVDTSEELNPNRKPTVNCCLNDENEFCLNSADVKPVEQSHDENISEEESKRSNDNLDSVVIEATFYRKCVEEATEVETINEAPLKESSDGEKSKIETEKPKFEYPDDENSSTVEKPILDATEADAPDKKASEVSCNGNLSSIELNESVVDPTEVKMSNNGSFSSVVESKTADEYGIEVEIPDKKTINEPSDDMDTSGEESKCSDIDVIEVETPDKKPAKKLLTESRAEVLDLNLSPPETTSSSQTFSDQSVEDLSRFGCGNVVSSTGESSAEIAADKQGHCISNLSIAISHSEGILEGSKSPSSCGVRRIKFKLSKNENGNDDVPSPKADSSSMEVDNDFFHAPLHIESNKNASSRKTFKNGRQENHIKDVKTFLSSGILEGVEVKYMNQEKKLLGGIIKECGYLCGCTQCNFSKVYDAYEFEQHAGCKSTCPNDHVCLNNGNSIHTIVEELKYAPVSSLDSVIRALVGPVFNEKAYFRWKESLEQQKNEKDEQSHLNLVDLSQTTMSCSSEVSEDSLVSVSLSMMRKHPGAQKMSTMQGISIEKKRTANKLSPLQNPSFGSAKKKMKKRDNDLHRLLFMRDGLPDGTELSYCTRGEKVLNGYKQGNGIMCKCCNTEISPSQFESHAGHAAKRQPYRHIYTSDGVSLHDVSLSLAKGQSLAISNEGEMCSICGDGGNLIVCDACSQIFHAACLDLERIPEGEWCCPHCQDKLGISRKLSSGESSSCTRPITIRLTRVVKAPPTDVGGCVVCRAPDFSVLKFDDRTIIFCDQCEKEYHVGCLRERGICDLKVLPEGKWFCSEDCCRIHTTLQKLICSGEKVVPHYMSNTIFRKLSEKGLVADVGVQVEWQVLSGKFRAEKHRSLLLRAIAIFRDSFDPIVVEETGLDLIPAMVCGGTVGRQEFGGIYCAVISVKSVVVSAGLFRIFGTEVAELPLVATSKESRGKGYFQVLFASIMKLLIFLNVGKLVLPAAEKAESIWIQKFGFRKMSDEQFQKYTKDIQLISFKGTMMLEKDVPRKQPQFRPSEK